MYDLLSKQANGPIKHNLKVKDIHDDFLAEANFLVDESNKAVKLTKLGFHNSKGAIQNLAKQEINEAEYFKRHYPLNKYLTNTQIQNLCKKYNLVFGHCAQFKGEIPDKNLKEIENFKVREEDFDIKMVDRQTRFIKKFGNVEFYICAPLKDMILLPNQYVDDRGFIIQDDPIVIKPTQYGGIIITMWGDEASDPSVINQINN